MRRLAALLSAAVGVRLALVLRGGQYFDWDEYRYGFATIMLTRLRDGDVGGMIDVLFRYPEHPGFKILGLVAAAFQSAVSGRYGHPIWDMRYPTGEWLAAFFFSLSSAISIGLTYAIARRSGADEDESLFASFLMFASTTVLMHAQHFFPYDAALAASLLALWLAMSGTTTSALATGAVAGAAFAIYEGYWLLAMTVALILISRQPISPRVAVRRTCFFAVGFALVPAILAALSASRGRSLVDATRRFAETVTHGEFSEGWSVPWAFLWHTEHALLIFVVAGLLFATLVTRSRRAIVWTMGALAIYGGLVAGSNILHRFVVYDRLVRQMWPFLCLAAAAGVASVDHGRWIRGRRAFSLYGAITVIFLLNIWPLATLRYPREIVGEVVTRYGSANVRFDTSLLNTVDATTAMFLPPLEHDARDTTTRYVLLNARDIWIDGETGTKPDPPGKVVARWTHPRQLRMWQYHGYSPAERAFLRETDFSIRLIDTRAREELGK